MSLKWSVQMVTEIILGILFLYCLALHGKIKKLTYAAQYGSPRCEKGFAVQTEKLQSLQDDLGKHSSRLWELEHKAGMHPPLSKELPYS
jgi:hypothetical protein